MHLIGIRHGRLSRSWKDNPQRFWEQDWQEEFFLARQLGFACLELSIDGDSFAGHPLMTPNGRETLRSLTRETGVATRHLSADIFMKRPFWSASAGEEDDELLRELVATAGSLGITYVQIPLFGQHRIAAAEDEVRLAAALNAISNHCAAAGVRILLESDLPPAGVLRLVQRCGKGAGCTYDMGNSAYFGFDQRLELTTYGTLVANVHVKDCTPKDYSVALGSGATDFHAVFSGLRQSGYQGDFILETPPGHAPAAEAAAFREFTTNLVARYFP